MHLDQRARYTNTTQHNTTQPLKPYIELQDNVTTDKLFYSVCMLYEP